MARYRPVAPEHAWRSERGTLMPREIRYAELYFLTSPFSNTIGCYKIAKPIVAIEMGLAGIAELETILGSLLEMKIIDYRYGHILVKEWFSHNSWESTFRGNVAKAASKEIAGLPLDLREAWVTSCLDAGVPVEAVRDVLPKASPSPSGAPAEGLPYRTTTEQIGTVLETTNHLPKTVGFEGYQPSGGSNPSSILLLPIAEPQRTFIEEAIKDLSMKDAQLIADEVCGALEAVKMGWRDPIRGLHGWLPKLVEQLKTGKFVAHAGLAVTERRRVAEAAVAQAAEQKLKDQQSLASQNAAAQRAQSLIDHLSEKELHVLADIAAGHQSLPANVKSRIYESIIRREIPNGIGRAVLLKAIEELKESASQFDCSDAREQEQDIRLEGKV